MTTENQEQEESQEGEQQEEQTIEMTPVEVEAAEHGWRPEVEFKAESKNDGKKWRSAEDFMDRKSFFDKIESVSAENKNLKKGMQALGQHYTTVEKAAFTKALATLKAQRMQALEDGEIVKAEKLRDEMDDVKEKINTVVSPVPVEEGPPAEFLQWKEKNSWYKRDDRMTRYADAVGRELQSAGKTPDQILKGVEREVKEAFPEKFRNPNRDRAPEVVPSEGRKASGGDTGYRLSKDEERILTNMIRGGAPITREQYIKDLKASRE